MRRKHPGSGAYGGATMTRRYDYYFVQRNAGDGWETLGESDCPKTVVDQLSERLSGPDRSEIRIVGVSLNDDEVSWSYHQLFYLDQSGIEFKTPGDGSVERDALAAITGDDTTNTTPLTEAEALDGPNADRPPLPAVGSVGEGQRPFTENETTPWSPDRSDEAARMPPAAPPEPPRTSPVFYGLITVLVAALIALGVLLYTKHPLVIATIETLGLGSYVRLAPEHVPAYPDAKSPDSVEPNNPPFTTGAVTRHVGVAPALHGRWSAKNCQDNFIEFTKDEYRRTANTRSGSPKIQVVETLRDDFQFHIRLSPNIVEHYKTITDNDIAQVGTTTARGYHASPGRGTVYSRCQ